MLHVLFLLRTGGDFTGSPWGSWPNIFYLRKESPQICLETHAYVGAARNPRSLLTADKIQNIRLDSLDTNQKNKTDQKDRASEGSSDPGEIVSNNSSIRLFKSPLASETDPVTVLSCLFGPCWVGQWLDVLLSRERVQGKPWAYLCPNPQM